MGLWKRSSLRTSPWWTWSFKGFRWTYESPGESKAGVWQGEGEGQVQQTCQCCGPSNNDGSYWTVGDALEAEGQTRQGERVVGRPLADHPGGGIYDLVGNGIHAGQSQTLTAEAGDQTRRTSVDSGRDCDLPHSGDHWHAHEGFPRSILLGCLRRCSEWTTTSARPISCCSSTTSQPGQPRPDTWAVHEEDGKKTLVRIHSMPRLALFSPTKVTHCPVSIVELTGQRTTIGRPLHGGSEARIEDDITVQRNFQDRWIGETQFEMKMGPRPLKVRRSTPKTGQKRPPDKEPQELRQELDNAEIDGDQAQQDGLQPGLSEDPERALPADDGDAFPDGEEETAAGAEFPGEAIPPSNLNEALLRHGSDAVDGLPVQLRGSAGSNQCPLPGCDLPGGHAGVHEGPEGKFLYDNYEGRKLITEEREGSMSSRRSATSEELLPDGDLQWLLAGGGLPVYRRDLHGCRGGYFPGRTTPGCRRIAPAEKPTSGWLRSWKSPRRWRGTSWPWTRRKPLMSHRPRSWVKWRPQEPCATWPRTSPSTWTTTASCNMRWVLAFKGNAKRA